MPAKDLSNAFSLTSMAMQIGAIVGPAMSGLVIAYVGQFAVYAIDAVTYLAVILALILMGAVRQEKDPSHHTTVSTQSIKEGIQFIIHQPIILSTMLIDFFATFFSSANTLMPIFARDVLGVGVVAYGWLSAAQSIGAVGAALVASQLREIRHQGRNILKRSGGLRAGDDRIRIIAQLSCVDAGAYGDRRFGFSQHDHPQHHPPAANPGLYPRADDQCEPDLFYGGTAIGGGGSGCGGAAAGGALRGGDRGRRLHSGGTLDRPALAAAAQLQWG